MGTHEKDSFGYAGGPFDRLRAEHLEGTVSADKLDKLTARFRAEDLDEKQLAILFGILAGRLGHELLTSILRSAATFVLAAREDRDSFEAEEGESSS